MNFQMQKTSKLTSAYLMYLVWCIYIFGLMYLCRAGFSFYITMKRKNKNHFDVVPDKRIQLFSFASKQISDQQKQNIYLSKIFVCLQRNGSQCTAFCYIQNWSGCFEWKRLEYYLKLIPISFYSKFQVIFFKL